MATTCGLACKETKSQKNRNDPRSSCRSIHFSGSGKKIQDFRIVLGILEFKVSYSLLQFLFIVDLLGVIIDGDYKVVVGSHSVLRRKASDYQTVWLYNIKEDPQEANDLRFQTIH